MKATLIKNPTGSFSFVGWAVDGRLLFATQDGNIPTAAELKTAQIVGPRMAHLKTRTWDSPEAAMRFAEALGIEREDLALEPALQER